jgi:hypothetical protein
MIVSTVVTLDAGTTTFAMTAEDAAAAVLVALGGDPAKDQSTVTLQAPTVYGEAGTPPPQDPPAT